MTLVNSQIAYSAVEQDPRKRKWYRHPGFPLLPVYEYRPGDEWNSNSFYFAWLFLRMWAMDSVSLGVSLELSDSGLFLALSLPWLRIYFGIPFPNAVNHWSYKHLWRSKRK